MSSGAMKDNIGNIGQSSQERIANFIKGSWNFKNGTSVSHMAIIMCVVIIILIICVCILYSKKISDNDKKTRTLSAVFLGIGGTLIYVLICLLGFAYKSKTLTTGSQKYMNIMINIFKISLFTYIYAVYCIFPLVVYVEENEDIYSHDQKYWGTHTHNHARATDIIDLITNILIICTMIYLVYLVFWHNETSVLKRQLLIIMVMFGVVVGKSIKEILTRIIKK